MGEYHCAFAYSWPDLDSFAVSKCDTVFFINGVADVCIPHRQPSSDRVGEFDTHAEGFTRRYAKSR